MIVSTKDRKSVLFLLNRGFQRSIEKNKLPLHQHYWDCGFLAVFSFSSLCCGQVVSEGPIKMPKHFMDIDERVEAVWHLLHVPDTAMVALVGMGGIGRIGILLLMLWHP